MRGKDAGRRTREKKKGLRQSHPRVPGNGKSPDINALPRRRLRNLAAKGATGGAKEDGRMEQDEKVVISKFWAALWVRHDDALGRSKLSDPFASSHRTRTDPGRHRPSFRDEEKSNEPKQWNCEYDDHAPRRSASSSVTRKNQRVPPTVLASQTKH